MGDAGQGQADDVEIVAFDARDVAASAALDGVGAGFVVGFFGCEVARYFFGGEFGEMDQGGLDEGTALGVGEADERDACHNGMGATGKRFEHMAGVVAGAWLAEDATVEGYDCVGGKDYCGADDAGRGEFGFGVSEALDEFAW